MISGDIPDYLNVSPKGPRTCTIDDINAYAQDKNDQLSESESISGNKSPVRVTIQQVDIENISSLAKKEGEFIEVKSKKKKVDKQNGGPKTRGNKKKVNPTSKHH